MMTRVLAPSRLHFGLFHAPIAGEHQPGERAFGGVGLMIDLPGVVVTVKPADSWQFEGPLASRAQAIAIRFCQTLPEEMRRPFQVLVERCPSEHVGFGVGTQLSLSVARAVAAGSGVNLAATILAKRVGRGERSAVGIHGFDHGGLIAETGKFPGEHISPLIAQTRLPESWRVVVFSHAKPGEWSGQRERSAFASAAFGPRDRLRELAESVILPAARSGDLDAFGDAVYDFNRLAGEPFAGSQGGVYASPAIEDLIGKLRKLGIRGVGQSSWGPTVFAIVADSDTALSLVLRFRSQLPVFVARVSSGHRVERR